MKHSGCDSDEKIYLIICIYGVVTFTFGDYITILFAREVV